MSNEHDTPGAVQAAVGKLGEQLAAQRARIEELERENAELRAKRDEYRDSLEGVLRDYYAANEDQVEAQFAEAGRTGISFEQLKRELPELFDAARETA